MAAAHPTPAASPPQAARPTPPRTRPGAAAVSGRRLLLHYLAAVFARLSFVAATASSAFPFIGSRRRFPCLPPTLILVPLQDVDVITVQAPPLLSSQSESEAESSLTDILVRKPSTSSAASGNLNPNVLAELFSMYREWQEENSKRISQKQEEIENKIETSDALAVKLLKRFNYSLYSMRFTSHNLAEVHPLQIEVGELKGRLTEVISNCDALCKRIAAEGPQSLRSSVEPFTAGRAEAEGSGSLDSKQET